MHEITGLDEVHALLERLERLGINTRPLLLEAANIVVNATDQSFEDEGPGWRALSPRTLRASYGGRTHTKRGRTTRGFERYLGKRKILQRSSRLRHSIAVEEIGTGVMVGTNLPYAAIHQFGGKTGRGKKTKIHARSYFPIENGGLRQIEAKAIAEYLRMKFESAL